MTPNFFDEKFTVGDWVFQQVAKNIFKVHWQPDPHGIAMTGSDVEKRLNIPFPHRWLRMTFYHTDSSYAVSTDALFIHIYRKAGAIAPLSKLVESLFREHDIVASKITEVWGLAFEYEACDWQLVLNSTSTDIIFPIFYVQRLPSPQEREGFAR